MTKNEFPDNHILLVEDEASLAYGLTFNLQEEGYRVTWAKDGREALEFFEQQKFDLIILDIMLPYFDGFQVAEKIRLNSPQLPILVLTARAAAKDRVRGLEIGVDDYIAKPFHLPELLLRINGMLRRKNWYREVTNVSPVFRFANFEINFTNMTCQSKHRTFRLTQREAMVLKYLVENRDKIVSRQELLKNVWQISSDVETRTVDNFIARLRKYFEPNPAKPRYIKSIRSAGYVFSEPEEDNAEDKPE